MIDEAFLPFRGIIERMLSFSSDLVDDEAGVRSYIYEYEIESPVELSVARGDSGHVQIGTTPPLYYVDTSLRPSYHKLRFTAQLDHNSDG